MRKVAIASALMLLAAGCSKEPADYFSKNKIGEGADFGVFKNGYHVITVHGYVDDLEACLKIMELFKEEGPRANFECRPLNH